MERAVGFYGSTVGKKVLMAVTGIILFGYVIGHMLGNFQIYIGEEQINSYAELLHKSAAFLWTARLVLLFCVGVHFVAAVQLWLRNRASRPVKYRVFRPPAVDYAARTMVWSGPIIAIFIAYHILHFTTGQAHSDYEHLKPFHNVIVAFSDPLIALVYMAANFLLAVHLYHGVWSFFQTMGWDHPKYGPWRRRFAVLVACAIGAGNISIPLAVLTGVVHL